MIDGRQIQAARVLLGWSADYLAHRAGIHRTTLRRIERSMIGICGQASTASRIEYILRDNGIDFFYDLDKTGVTIKNVGKSRVFDL